jgi:hypothetical protein
MTRKAGRGMGPGSDKGLPCNAAYGNPGMAPVRNLRSRLACRSRLTARQPIVCQYSGHPFVWKVSPRQEHAQHGLLKHATKSFRGFF